MADKEIVEEPEEETEEPIEKAPEEAHEEPTEEEQQEYVDLLHEGKEVKVTKAEARELAMKGYDYTQQMQRLADRGREYDKGMESLSAIANDQQTFLQYHSAIEYCNQQIKAIGSLNLEAVKADSPERYQELMEKRRELREIKQEAAEGLDHARGELQNHANQAMARRIEENKTILTREIPGWGDKLYGELLDYAVSQGIQREYASQVVEAPMFKILHKAMLRDKALKGAADKRQGIEPTGIKPGAAPRGRPSGNRAQLLGNLKKSGSVQDAARLFERML